MSACLYTWDDMVHHQCNRGATDHTHHTCACGASTIEDEKRSKIRSNPEVSNRLLADVRAREKRRRNGPPPPPIQTRRWREGDAVSQQPMQGGLPSLGKGYS